MYQFKSLSNGIGDMNKIHKASVTGEDSFILCVLAKGPHGFCQFGTDPGFLTHTELQWTEPAMFAYRLHQIQVEIKFMHVLQVTLWSKADI